MFNLIASCVTSEWKQRSVLLRDTWRPTSLYPWEPAEETEAGGLSIAGTINVEVVL